MTRSIRSSSTAGACLLAAAAVLLPATASAVQGVWRRGADMPTARSLSAASVVDGRIYVVGGLVIDGAATWVALPTVEVYDPVSDTWTARADMPTARGGLQAVTIDGTIYALGGYGGGTGGGPQAWDASNFTDALEVYDPLADTWQTRAPMTARRYLHVGVAIGRTIVAIGGRTGSQGGIHIMLAAAEAYDPSADAWTAGAAMPFETTARGVAIDGRAYVFGGSWDSFRPNSDRDAGIACLEYDPTADVWTRKSPRSTNRHDSFAAAAVRGTAYLFGGADVEATGSTLASVEAYDPATDTWTRLGDMPRPLRVAASAVVDGRVYLVGGREDAQAATTADGDLSTLYVFEPARDHLVASATRDVHALSGRTWEQEVEVVLAGPIDGAYPELWLDPSSIGQDGAVPLAHEASGRYQTRIRAALDGNAQYSLPIRTGTPDAPGIYLYRVEVSVWPGERLNILAEGMAPGWQSRSDALEEVVTEQADAVHVGNSACAVRAPSTSTRWSLALETEEPVGSFGYQSVHLAFHPGDVTATRFSQLDLYVGDPRNAVDLLDRFDLERREWQEIDIPLTSFGEPQAVAAVGLSGNLAGTFYLDEVCLVPATTPPMTAVTAVTETRTGALPSAFALDPNYPNPFNGSTVIGFHLPAAGDVELCVFDLLGQRVATLAGGHRAAGAHALRWDGRDDAGRPLASGPYLYRLRAGKRSETRKLLLLR